MVAVADGSHPGGGEAGGAVGVDAAGRGRGRHRLLVDPRQVIGLLGTEALTKPTLDAQGRKVGVRHVDARQQEGVSTERDREGCVSKPGDEGGR